MTYEKPEIITLSADKTAEIYFKLRDELAAKSGYSMGPGHEYSDGEPPLKITINCEGSLSNEVI